MRNFSRLLILCMLFFGIQLAYAQTTLTPDLSITAIPSDPKPFQEVLLRAESYAIDLDQASIIWKYNGIIVASGIGKRTITITAPGNGQVGTVEMSARSAGVAEGTASVILRPASIDMLWEAVDSYTPPFYKGKALPSIEGKFRFVAIPTASAPRQVSYHWSQNETALPMSSGYGKSSIVVTPSVLDKTVDVSVAAESGTFTGSGKTSVTARTPSLVAYLKKDGFIDYANGATSAIQATGSGTTVHFGPYYFSTTTDPVTDLSFELTVDGKSVFGSPENNELRFSRPEDGAGATINVTIESAAHTLQRLTRTFTLSFN